MTKVLKYRFMLVPSSARRGVDECTGVGYIAKVKHLMTLAVGSGPSARHYELLDIHARVSHSGIEAFEYLRVGNPACDADFEVCMDEA